MGATPWRFKSTRPHQSKSKDPLRRVFLHLEKMRCSPPAAWLKVGNSGICLDLNAPEFIDVLTESLEPCFAQRLECFASRFASCMDVPQSSSVKPAFPFRKRVQDVFEIHSCAEQRNDVTYFLALLRCQFAGVAELADAYGSGPYGGNPMEVQVLSPAPFEIERPASAGLFAYADNCSALPFVSQTYPFWCETLCFILVDAALLSSGWFRLLL